MTISIPTLPPETVPSGANQAAPDANSSAPADAFDQFMPVDTPAAESSDEPADTADGDAPASEQAAVLAASLLWAPLPMLVETPPPAPELNLETGAPAPDAGPAPVVEESVENVGAKESPVGRALCPIFEAEMSGIKPDLQKTPAALPVDQNSLAPAPVEPATPEGNAEAAVAAAGQGSPDPEPLNIDRGVLRRPLRNPADNREENIAGRMNPVNRDLPESQRVLAKTFVSSTQQEVRGEEEIVGTDVANSGSTMPFALAAQPSFTASPVTSAAAAVETATTSFDLSAATEPAQQARDTVATVLSVIDAQEKPESAENRTVNLDFNFGEERLAVRVEFRDGAVRAHFRTQSLELRAALSAEWQHVAAAPENVLRLAEPVFVTSSRAEQSASFNADGGASRQQAQTPTPEFHVRPAPAGYRASSATADLPEAPRLRSLPTALHLQAVA